MIFLQLAISLRVSFRLKTLFLYDGMAINAVCVHSPVSHPIYKDIHMTQNPLMALIIPILRNADSGLSEYQLIKKLEQSTFPFPFGPEVSPDLLLFRKHFLVMNALYQLQELFWEENLQLEISALNISLRAIDHRDDEMLPVESADQALRDYYLDWRQFEDSSDAQVEELLQNFWQRYFTEDQRAEALAALNLTDGSSWQEIRLAYRQQASLHHPDRGGDSSRFRAIREAYECLACSRVSEASRE